MEAYAMLAYKNTGTEKFIFDRIKEVVMEAVSEV
jgi:hypothetical protein